MYRRYIYSAIMLAVALLSTACSSKIPEVSHKKAIYKGVETEMLFVEGKESWRSPSAGYNVKTRNIHTLQNAAEATLKQGKRYFAIHLPQGEASNTGGSLINTAQEFLEKCTPSSGNIFDAYNQRCGFDGQLGYGGASAYTSMVIIPFQEKPTDILTYNATEVLEYLRINGHYREDGYEEK